MRELIIVIHVVVEGELRAASHMYIITTCSICSILLHTLASIIYKASPYTTKMSICITHMHHTYASHICITLYIIILL